MPSCEALNVNAPQEAVVHFLHSMLQLLTNSSQPLTLAFSSWGRVWLEDKMEKAHFLKDTLPKGMLTGSSNPPTAT